jgi:hypothetical protein
MGITFRSIGIGSGVLLALMVVRPVKADEFNFTFTPNQTECAKGWTSPCTDFGSGTFTVDPPRNDIFYYGAMPIIAMTGTLNGSSAMSFVLQGYPALSANLKIAPSPYNFPVIFLANGQQWAFVHYDLYPSWYSFLVDYNTNSVEPINLTITAPEPSTLLFLSIALLGLVGLTLLKSRLS